MYERRNNDTPRLSHRLRPLLVALALFTVSAGVSVVAAAPALADSTLCKGTSYSVCISAGYTDHGYGGNSKMRYWGADPYHNCTNYVAYVETQNGVTRPSYSLHNAWQWWSEASGHVPENGTPAAGAVAWWGKNQGGVGSLGHVAYVELVNGDGSITISEDASPGGPFDWKIISPGSSRWPGGFIHFKDLPNPHSAGSGDFNGDGKSDLAFFTPGAGFAVAYGTSTGFTEAGRYLTNWATPTWGADGSFPGQNGIGFPK